MSELWKERIRIILDEQFGGNRALMSRKAGRNATWVRDLLEQKGAPRVESLQRLAEVSGKSIEWILGADVSDEKHYYSTEGKTSRIAGSIPQIDAEAGAGDGNVGEIYQIASGGIVSGHRIVDEWLVPRAELGVDPGRVIVLPVVGTSMMPSLHSGDKVMVDTGSTGIKNGEIYVLDEGDGPIVKRVRVLRDEDPVQIEIISENPAVSPLRRPAELVRVIGRVIGRWTRM